MASPWQELQIEPTGDVVAIRRAFRARLDPTRPEEAARLQAAYEGAIASLPLASAQPGDVDTTQIEAIGDAIDRGQALRAATLIAEGRARSNLTLRQDMEAVERLLALLVDDLTIAHDQIGRAADAIGWLAGGELPAGAPFSRLRRRLAAERWLDATRDTAGQRRPFDARTAAARILLGRRPALPWRVVPPRAALRALLTALNEHRPWIAHRLELGSLEIAKRIAGSDG